MELPFSTMGDSRQNPKNPVPTTIPDTSQDQKWLQNTKDWSRIIRSVEHQMTDYLFFNGDISMGYGKVNAPATISPSGVFDCDLLAFYKPYGFWHGMTVNLMETGPAWCRHRAIMKCVIQGLRNEDPE